MANHSVAKYLFENLLKLADKYADFSDLEQQYFKAVLLYFIESDDDEHDFDSTIGFDDDVEAFNAFCAYSKNPDFIISLDEIEE